jgi:formate C-acetyltransferase
MHELVELEGERVRSMGQFDRTLYPFYRADIDAGRLTKAQAKELILFFWYKWYARTRGEANGKNFCFAGRYADGSEITNELTYLALDAHEQLRTPDPKLSVRFGPDAPNGLYRRVAELIRSGEHSLVLLNDSVAVDALIARGKSPEDARCYLPIGCYEPAVEGKEIGCTMNITVNLAKCLELALHDGVDPATGKRLGPPTGRPAELESFEAVRQAYTTQVNAFLERSLACIGAAESEWPRINPSPLPAGTFESCIERGKDIGQGGPVYNSVGFVGAGLANVVDSLVALRQVVFDERRLSMAELVAALDADFAGREPLRMYLLNRPPKWGNNDETADAVGVLVAEHYCDKVHTFTNKRGGTCQAALFTLTFALRGGKRTGALPDGRRAGESLAPGQGAGYGRDRNGVTALLGSVAKLDGTKTPNGAVVDVTLQPNVVEGETGIANLVSLIKTYFALGGYGLQFNIFDLETLKAAQRYPERYATLQVRVTGWSVYFTSLTRLEQDQYLARIAHSH